MYEKTKTQKQKNGLSISAENLHHAYLIEGSRGTAVPELRVFCKKELGCHVQGDPDFFYKEIKTFGIDESKYLKEFQSRRPLKEGGKKIFVIVADEITEEAQNALLKIFEEPAEGTHFFLILPQASALLPTLLSRLMTLRLSRSRGEIKIAQEFLFGDYEKRTALFKDITEEKDKEGARVFLNNIEEELYGRWKGNLITAEYANVFEELEKCRRYLSGRSPSVKIILEYLALVLPRV